MSMLTSLRSLRQKYADLLNHFLHLVRGKSYYMFYLPPFLIIIVTSTYSAKVLVIFAFSSFFIYKKTHTKNTEKKTEQGRMLLMWASLLAVLGWPDCYIILMWHFILLQVVLRTKGEDEQLATSVMSHGSCGGVPVHKSLQYTDIWNRCLCTCQQHKLPLAMKGNVSMRWGMCYCDVIVAAWDNIN